VQECQIWVSHERAKELDHALFTCLTAKLPVVDRSNILRNDDLIDNLGKVMHILLYLILFIYISVSRISSLTQPTRWATLGGS